MSDDSGQNKAGHTSSDTTDCGLKRNTGSNLNKEFQAIYISEPEPKRARVMEEAVKLFNHTCYESGSSLLDSVESEERCCGCNKLAFSPLTADCGHIFGKEVVGKAQEKGVFVFRCPGGDDETGQCPNVIEIESLIPNRPLTKQILKKKIRCTNKDLGCEEITTLKGIGKHLEEDCQYALVTCSRCTEKFQRNILLRHQAGCKSRTCDFSPLGCTHVTSPDAASTSVADAAHGVGVHFALIFQALSAARSVAEFSATTLNAALNRHSYVLTCQEEAVRMLENPGQTKADDMQIQELTRNYINGRMDARNNIEKFNELVHTTFPVEVAEPTLRMKYRSEYQEREQEETTETMTKLMKETLEAPILLNHGSMIFQICNFSEKRTAAIKGELKRGVYGPPFYTHEYGYLMVPIVYPNGDGNGAGTHLSIFIAIKKGPYDSLLRWPVIGRITLSILSQRRVGREAVRHSFRTDIASLSYHRPSTEMNQASGIPKALDLNLLKQPSDFLVDDTLFIQIVAEPHLPDK